MDPQIEELKTLVRRNIELSEQTAAMVRSMERSARTGRMLKVLWIAALIALPLAGYYIFLAPYLDQIQSLYGAMQSGAGQAQDLGALLRQYLSQLGSVQAQ